MHQQENLLNQILKFLQALITFTSMLAHKILCLFKGNQIHIFTASRDSQDTVSIRSSYEPENKTLDVRLVRGIEVRAAVML